MAWAEAYLRIKLHLDPSSRLATIYMDLGLADYTDAGKACAHQFRMWAAAVPLSVGELDPHLTQCGRDRGPLARRVSS